MLLWSRSSRSRSIGGRSNRCGLGRRLAFGASAHGVVRVELLKDVDVARRPDNFLLETRPPLIVTVWAVLNEGENDQCNEAPFF